MQVFFEANTADFAKRKRVARACKTCQKRKKRCHHVFQGQGSNEAYSSDGAVPASLPQKEPARFVGDLNAEGVLRDLSSRAKGEGRNCSVGIIVDPALQNGADSRNPTDADSRSLDMVERHGRIERGRRTLTDPERNYLQAAGAFRVLPKITQDVLVTTWFSCIDGVLPILDGAKFLQEYAKGTASRFLVLAICLITCKTEEAVPYLKVTEDGPFLGPVAFARSLYVGLDAAMKADLESDRLTKIQILALMSLHNDGPSGLEDSAWHLAHAIQDANTLAIHIHTAGRRTNDQQSYIWWCLWVMDKINACVAGRSIMISDRDIGIARPPPQDETGFKNKNILMWLALCDVLTDVISLYRPTSDQTCTGWEQDFPTLEEIVGPFDFHEIQKSEQKILELCYNVIAILSCRTGDSTTASYARRVIAGDRIQSLMASGYDEHVAPFPLVPYAVSLSLTVAYRIIRDSNFTSDSPNSDTARRNLATRCSILESLSPRYWPADAMAKLGRKALMSLNQPHAASPNRVAHVMETEVSVCKPLTTPGYRHDLDGNPGRLGPSQSHPHALDVLSTAAATYGDRNRNSADVGLHSEEDGGGGGGGGACHVDSGVPSEVNGAALGDIDFGQLDTFQDLDTLFDDFFDLSMPTFFQDPLFDGVAYDFGDIEG